MQGLLLVTIPHCFLKDLSQLPAGASSPACIRDLPGHVAPTQVPRDTLPKASSRWDSGKGRNPHKKRMRVATADDGRRFWDTSSFLIGKAALAARRTEVYSRRALLGRAPDEPDGLGPGAVGWDCISSSSSSFVGPSFPPRVHRPRVTCTGCSAAKFPVLLVVLRPSRRNLEAPLSPGPPILAGHLDLRAARRAQNVRVEAMNAGAGARRVEVWVVVALCAVVFAPRCEEGQVNCHGERDVLCLWGQARAS